MQAVSINITVVEDESSLFTIGVVGIAVDEAAFTAGSSCELIIVVQGERSSFGADILAGSIAYCIKCVAGRIGVCSSTAFAG